MYIQLIVGAKNLPRHTKEEESFKANSLELWHHQTFLPINSYIHVGIY
jgi:hypothetical protein